ncbi:two-component system response regulator [Sodalinema gerasimenkoae]|uniref:two-component system response regulator n=1 Tax=Sodalinema gerasimenkoae TaxID=2862348 RepID=UPI00135AEF23|nr:EAL domain-containing response regulator [Sodalinema gerasimenkoae]
MNAIPTTSQSILIVDDDPANLEVLSSLLERSGYEVLVARDGQSAIERAQYDPPALICLDVMMPGIDGFETCRRLKANSETAAIPVIFMTALSDLEHQVLGLELGAVDYIPKPFYEDVVLSRVQLHLQLRSLTDSLTSQNHQLEQLVGDRTHELQETIYQLQTTQQELQEREQQLAYDALHDSLTGLTNRVWLMNRLNRLINDSDNAQEFAVLFLDLDRFKVINDSLGHLAGDALLETVAQRLLDALERDSQEWDLLSPDFFRPGMSTVSRLGGDEFVILLENISNLDDVLEVVRRVQRQFSLPFYLDQNYEVFTNASIGIALKNSNYSHCEDVLRDADIAMYQAKQAGRGQYAIFNPKMQARAKLRLELENELRHAVEHGIILQRDWQKNWQHFRSINRRVDNEFSLYYQPLICLKTGRVRGFEALLRWHHPQKGLISPIDFIPISEEIGLIHQLGSWVFYESCQQLSRWRSQFPDLKDLTLNVNLSTIQLMQPQLVEFIETTLMGVPLPKGCIKLEITETCLLQSNAQVFDILRKLQELGLSLCIDDFGTGYSSLSRLHEFPVHTLKIDKAFVARLQEKSNGTTDNGNEIVHTIITLAHALGMDAVAEGIETPMQLAIVRAMGCELAQGYLFSRPLPPEEAVSFLVTPERFTDWMPPFVNHSKPSSTT